MIDNIYIAYGTISLLNKIKYIVLGVPKGMKRKSG